MLHRILVTLTVAACLLAIGSLAAAQPSSEGTIRGYIRDEQGGALPGVTVTASSPTVAGGFPTVSDAQGFFRLITLPPGVYTVAAELSGFARFTRTGVVVRAGLNLALDITMKLGTLEETVEVKAETPLLETQKSVQAINISGEFQRALPLESNRNWYSFLEVTPGVVARQGTAGLSNHYMLRGSEIEVNRVLVDGADMGSFRQGRVDYLGMSTDAMQDVQVKTGGIDASAPLGSGVVINMATPTGSNQLHGAASAIFTPKSWNGNNLPEGTPATREVLQPDLSLGGPIARERAWFFAAYRYTRRAMGITRTPEQLALMQAVVPNFQAFDNNGRLNYLYLKTTLQLNPSHQVYAFWHRDINPDETNRVTNAENFENQSLGGDGLGLRLSSVWGKALTTRVLASYSDKTLNRDLSVFEGYMREGPSRPLHQSSFISGGRRRGTGELVLLNNLSDRRASPAIKTTIQADATYFASGFVGSHELQAGVYLQPKLWNEDRRIYSGQGFAVEEVQLRDPTNPSAGYIPFHRRIYDVAELVTKTVAATDYAVYVQDSWKPIPRLTLNVGMRVDWVKTEDRLFDVTMQDNAANVGPRLGATYVLTADNRNVARASWGRVHEMLIGNYIPTAGSTAAGYRDLYDNDLNGTFELELLTPASRRLSTDRKTDPDLHQPFIDEWLLGYQRQLPGQTGLDVSFVRRNYRDLPALVEFNGIYESSVFRGYKNEDFNDMFLVTNNRYNWFVYSGLEFTFSKRSDRFQMLAGYTRGWQHTAGTWQPNDPAAFIQPGAFPNNKGIGTIRANTTNSLSGTADTRAGSWQKHALRIGVSYLAPRGVVLASNYVMLSGPYSGPVVDRIAASDPAFGPATLRLSNGRLVSNPLATTIRFAYPTRGEGQVKAPNQHTWNVRAAKEFRIGRSKLELAFDVFNLLNDDTDQDFLDGGNQLYSPNYARRADGSFLGTLRVPPRGGQVSVGFTF